LCLSNPTGNQGQTPIGLSPILRQFPQHIEGDYDTNDINWQVSLRWRPNNEMSTFIKYANAFKAGGFDFGKTFFRADHATETQFEFKDEYAWSTEAGIKGTMMDGRANYELTAFYSEFEDLQRSAHDTVLDQTRVTNAAKQSVRGIEARGSIALSDRWQVNLSGAILNGKMDSFPGAICTAVEITQNLCLDKDGNPDPSGKIDRSGQEAVRSPDWSLVIGSNYWMPVMDEYKVMFNGQLSYSDGFILSDTAVRIVDMPVHADLNLTVGFGPKNDTWKLSLYGRNLTNPMPQYNPEFDIAPSGYAIADVSSRMVASYGLQLRYDF